MPSKRLENMKPGEIWWVELSVSSTDTVGHEQGKKRPCILIVNNPHIQMTTIIPLTSNLKAKDFPDSYFLKKSTKNGLIQDSIALIFQLRSLSYKRYQNKSGNVDSKDLSNLKELIKSYLGL